MIPRGFAHGFLVLSDKAEFCYKCDDFYHPNDEGGLAWNDPEIGIEWPGVVGKYTGTASSFGYSLDGVNLKLSDKDQKWSNLSKFGQSDSSLLPGISFSRNYQVFFQLSECLLL